MFKILLYYNQTFVLVIKRQILCQIFALIVLMNFNFSIMLNQNQRNLTIKFNYKLFNLFILLLFVLFILFKAVLQLDHLMFKYH
mgnify:CR=1